MAMIAARSRIIVVDDSRVFREAVATALRGEPDMEVVGAFTDGRAALEYLRAHSADVITLDVEMPGMDGLAFLAALRDLCQTRPLAECPGVIMVSAHTKKGADITITALQAGAFDFINKPGGAVAQENQDTLKRQLLVKIRCLVSQRSLRICQGKPLVARSDTIQENIAKSRDGASVPGAGQATQIVALAPPDNEPGQEKPATTQRTARLIKAVLIGVSTGGPKALACLLPELCRVVRPPVLVVQHMPPDFTRSLAESLSRICPCPVAEAVDGELLGDHRVYIAPGGKHLTVRRSGNGPGILSLNDQPPENGCRPAVDVLFRTASVAIGGQTLAIVLTGMGSDGVRGLGALKRAGCYAIAQDEESCVVWGMPGSVVRAGLADEVLPLSQIARAAGELCS